MDLEYSLTDSEKSLRDYLDVILRRAWVVISVFVVVIVVAVNYT